MNNGPIYVRERGSLRRVSDIVLAEPKPGSSSCRRTNPFVPKKEHFIFTYNEEGSLRYTTKSLFDIALQFVTNNIHHVDSLVGFPEQIGDRLFAAAEENRVFLNPDIAPKALQLFSDAYGDMVLESLCLRHRFPLLHERMDEIKMFHSLKRLDLYGCRLGDNHELFPHLTSSSLASLIQLFIGDNGLSDAGLQRLTTPIRMMQKGLDSLQHLDISYNPVSEKALRYFTCLPKLINLDVSGTSMKLGAGLKKTMLNLLGLIPSEEPLDTFDHSRCKTEGWAEQVINQWEINGSQMPKQKKMDESRTSALRFFGRQRFVREALNVAHQTDENMEEDNCETLHFYRPTSSHMRDNPIPSTANHQLRHQSEKCDTGPRTPQAKPSPSLDLTSEDIDLLNSY
ncbi:leucine-rich repeat-containing protein 42 isoform 2-T2 [Pholidichthys leucotaenia]